MKISVSMRAEDLAFLDAYTRRHQLPSRSAALKAAVDALKGIGLETAYEQAWDEWAEDSDSALWDSATGDGI